jgi:hypothetical protein
MIDDATLNACVDDAAAFGLVASRKASDQNRSTIRITCE